MHLKYLVMFFSLFLLGCQPSSKKEQVNYYHKGSDDYAKKLCMSAVPQSTRAMHDLRKKGKNRQDQLDFGLSVFYANFGGVPADAGTRQSAKRIIETNNNFINNFPGFNNDTHAVISMVSCLMVSGNFRFVLPAPAFPVFEKSIKNCEVKIKTDSELGACIVDVMNQYKIRS